MSSFNQQFIIHPVGQGLFYSGRIIHNSEVKFRMVFDCGSNGTSTSAGHEEVDIYRDADFLNINILDLLVISHFDQDHVNHIGRLVAGGIIIKKLVMPFITFEERLFLVGRFIDANNGYNPGDDFFIRFTIDPLGTLNENLDGDSEIFLIEGEPDSPIPPDKEIGNNESGNENSERFVFDFDPQVKKTVLANEIRLSKPRGKLYKVNHINKATVKSSRLIFLMDFLFYRRKISNIDEEFYEKVKEFFFEEFSIPADLSIENQLKKVKEVVKGISASPKIKSIFIKAKKEFHLKSKKDELVIEDLNTTALCLLHKNLNGIFQLMGITQKDLKHYPYWWRMHDNSGAYQIQKFISDVTFRIETPLYYRESFNWRNREKEDRFLFPNVMLTADCFLLTKDQVTEFLNHYKNYWEDFWLFQLPHHGSDKSSNNLLHSNIPNLSMTFINYGIGNKHSHPTASVINDLVATGNSTKIISVTEYNGLRFCITI